MTLTSGSPAIETNNVLLIRKEETLPTFFFTHAVAVLADPTYLHKLLQHNFKYKVPEYNDAIGSEFPKTELYQWNYSESFLLIYLLTCESLRWILSNLHSMIFLLVIIAMTSNSNNNVEWDR